MPGHSVGWMEGQKDGQTLIYRTLQATAEGPTESLELRGII